MGSAALSKGRYLFFWAEMLSFVMSLNRFIARCCCQPYLSFRRLKGGEINFSSSHVIFSHFHVWRHCKAVAFASFYQRFANSALDQPAQAHGSPMRLKRKKVVLDPWVGSFAYQSIKNSYFDARTKTAAGCRWRIDMFEISSSDIHQIHTTEYGLGKMTNFSQKKTFRGNLASQVWGNARF